MAMDVEAPGSLWVRVMKIYLVANATDMVMQRTLYNVGPEKLISYVSFSSKNGGHTPDKLARWVERDLLSVGPSKTSITKTDLT